MELRILKTIDEIMKVITMCLLKYWRNLYRTKCWSTQLKIQRFTKTTSSKLFTMLQNVRPDAEILYIVLRWFYCVKVKIELPPD